MGGLVGGSKGEEGKEGRRKSDHEILMFILPAPAPSLLSFSSGRCKHQPFPAYAGQGHLPALREVHRKEEESIHPLPRLHTHVVREGGGMEGRRREGCGRRGEGWGRRGERWSRILNGCEKQFDTIQ